MRQLSDKKIICGPGGLHCRCCCRYGLSDAKRALNRRVRRAAKQGKNADE